MSIAAATSQGWTHRALLTRGTRWLALVVMAVSFLFPVGGLGFDICWVHGATGLPCPGCGMTRALSAMSQGQWSAALGLHPFVLFFWPVLAALAVLALLPQRIARRVEARLDTIGPQLTLGYRLVLTAFLAFGLIRFGVFLVLGERFP